LWLDDRRRVHSSGRLQQPYATGRALGPSLAREGIAAGVFSRDGRGIVIAYPDGRICIWDAPKIDEALAPRAKTDRAARWPLDQPSLSCRIGGEDRTLSPNRSSC
jgi:hypothetical protein